VQNWHDEREGGRVDAVLELAVGQRRERGVGGGSGLLERRQQHGHDLGDLRVADYGADRFQRRAGSLAYLQ